MPFKRLVLPSEAVVGPECGQSAPDPLLQVTVLPVTVMPLEQDTVLISGCQCMPVYCSSISAVEHPFCQVLKSTGASAQQSLI